ncbi:MAG: zinc-ribbon domain containing protein [Candidatus Dormibacteria bacterium]
MSFEDKTLKCRECGGDFIWRAGEQEFYATRGLVNQPGRCPDCRAMRRDRDGGGGARGGSGGGGGGGFRREMHEVVCAACGVTTEVPFLPTNGRPVYCRDCFQTVRAR